MPTNIVPFSPVRNFMKTLGAAIVARDAIYFLNQFLEEIARDISKESLKIVSFARRKKINKEDILFVLQNKYKNIIENKIISEKPSYLAFSPMRHLMMEEHCEVVSKEAVLFLNVFLEICIEIVTKKSINLLAHIEVRKKITLKDITYIINELFGQKVASEIIKINKPKQKKVKLTKSIKCAFCGNECSPNAKMCPKCGDPFD